MQIKKAQLRAPGKLNLGLKITGVRGEGPHRGYHEIESLFVPVSIFDEIEISWNPVDPKFKEEVNYVDLATLRPLHFQNDLVSKALKVFRENFGPVPNLQIQVKKGIPIGAGMGGGSSDAGAILNFLLDTFGQGGTIDTSGKLMEAALKVGADVPFFLQSKPALVSGIGEKLKATKVERLFFVVIRPDFEVNTKEAYGWYDAESGLTRCNTDVTPGKINEVSGPSFYSNLSNDFEKSVEKRHPEIIMMKSALRTRGALGNLMSGTGSSVYGIFRSLTEALSARDSLQGILPAQYAYFICETVI